MAGGVAGEHAVEGFDVAAGLVEVNVVVFQKLGGVADGFFVVLLEELGGAVGLVGAESQSAENVDAEVEGAAEGLAVEREHAAFLELVGVHAAAGAGENLEVGEMFLDGVHEVDGLGLVVDGDDDRLGAGGAGGAEEAADDVAEAAEAGDDDGVFLMGGVDLVGLARGGVGAGEAGLNEFFVDDEKERRERHGERDGRGERGGLGGG